MYLLYVIGHNVPGVTLSAGSDAPKKILAVFKDLAIIDSVWGVSGKNARKNEM